MQGEQQPKTFYITDRRMLLHANEWDPTHIEKPERLSSLLDEIERAQLVGQKGCEVLESTEATIDDLLLANSQQYLEEIEASAVYSREQCYQLASTKEDVYVNQHTWSAAKISTGCAVRAMEAVIGRSFFNSFAAIRPPGHHASRDTPCGFCIFNNVAICAKKARKMGVKRVLIVDWDVHFGNGTQRIIEDDPEGLKLISIHRYEHGRFWPEMREAGLAKHQHLNTINVPLDELAYGDVEYVAFMNQLVLPIIADWAPELVLVSGGFDAALGDREGEMEVSPLGFGYMAGILASLGTPLCVLLEGGYFIGEFWIHGAFYLARALWPFATRLSHLLEDSVAKGGLFTLNALIERRPPVNYADNFTNISPRPSFLRTLFMAADANSDTVAVFSEWLTVLNTLRGRRGLSSINAPASVDYQGSRNVTYPYQMIDLYPRRAEEIERGFAERLKRILTHHEESLAKGQSGKPKLVLRVLESNTLELLRENPEQRWELVVNSVCRLHFVFFFVLLPLAQQHDIELVEGSGESADRRLSGLPRELDDLCKLLQLPDNSPADVAGRMWDTLESVYDSFDILRHLVYFT